MKYLLCDLDLCGVVNCRWRDKHLSSRVKQNTFPQIPDTMRKKTVCVCVRQEFASKQTKVDSLRQCTGDFISECWREDLNERGKKVKTTAENSVQNSITLSQMCVCVLNMRTGLTLPVYEINHIGKLLHLANEL